MRTKNFVTWNDLSEKIPEKSKRKYLVALIDKQTDEANMQIAYYYKKGETVYLKKRQKDKLPDNATNEQKLLDALFGDEKRVEIDGFYEITTVSCRINEEMAEEITDVSTYDNIKAIKWTELPLPPIGTKHPYEIMDQSEQQYTNYKKEIEIEKQNALEDFLQNNETAKNIYALPYRVSYTNGLVLENVTKNRKIAVCITALILEYMHEKKEEFDILRNGIETDNFDEKFEKTWQYIMTDKDGVMHNLAPGIDTGILIKTYELLSILFQRMPYGYILSRLMEKRTPCIIKDFCNTNKEMFPEEVLHRILLVNFNFIEDELWRIHRIENIGLPQKETKTLIYDTANQVVKYITILLSHITEPLSPEMAACVAGTNEGVFGGYRDFEHIYGISPDGTKETEPDPACETGVVSVEENGQMVIPHYGKSEDGEIVTYSANRHIWDKNQKTFSSVRFGKNNKPIPVKKYEIIDYKKIY